MGSFLGVVRVLCIYLFVAGVTAKNTCQEPKVRREWRTFSPSEKAEWIRAVNCLAAHPHDPKLAPSVPANISLIPPVNETSSFYDDLAYAHMDLSSGIHWTGMFLPWYRYFLQYFEDALVEKCGYDGTTPYWDWTQDAHDFYNSDMFDGSSSGVGGWGDPTNDYQISTGGFKDLIVAYPTSHRIRRDFALRLSIDHNPPPLFTDQTAPLPPKGLMINTTTAEESVTYSVNNFVGDFIGFQAYIESPHGLRGGANLILSGDMTGFCPDGADPPACVMGSKWSPNDPLFYMQYAMIDKVWHDWQEKNPKNKYSYGGGSVSPIHNLEDYVAFPTGLPPFLHFGSPIPGDGLWNVRVRDVIDTKGDILCYTYA